MSLLDQHLPTKENIKYMIRKRGRSLLGMTFFLCLVCGYGIYKDAWSINQYRNNEENHSYSENRVDKNESLRRDTIRPDERSKTKGETTQVEENQENRGHRIYDIVSSIRPYPLKEIFGSTETSMKKEKSIDDYDDQSIENENKPINFRGSRAMPRYYIDQRTGMANYRTWQGSSESNTTMSMSSSGDTHGNQHNTLTYNTGPNQQIKLTGVMIGRVRQAALEIGGEHYICTEGDIVKGCTIISIETERVLIRVGSVDRWITLD
ncbi:hypothetical protein [Veillonella montpellierensis]|uniref:hypothetical protein n=1 Tax=Veillonella montpellierensis TaxID=187328 RepID=UPI0023FA0FA2|nr:hypothetical protein [Veillonella montpellierensis]